MKVTGNHYELTPSGILVHPEEDLPEIQPLLFSFVDVLSLSDKGEVLSFEESGALGTLVEKWIREHLSRSEQPFPGRSELNAAFAYANQRLLQSDATGLNQVAVSIIVALPSSDEEEMIVAGVGDCRLIQYVGKEQEVLLQDPLNERMQMGLNPEERLFTLQNAIGIREHLLVHTTSLPITHYPLFATSYGFSSQMQEEKIGSLLEKQTAETDPFPELLKSLRSEGHQIQLKSISIGSPIPEATFSTSEETQTHTQQRPTTLASETKKRIATIGLSMATCALLLGVTAVMLEPANKEAVVTTPKEELLAQRSKTTELELRALQNAEKDQRELIMQLEAELSETKKALQATTVIDQTLSKEEKEAKGKERRWKEELATAAKRVAYLEKTVDTLENIVSSQQGIDEKLKIALADQEILQTAVLERDLAITELEEKLSKQPIDGRSLSDKPLIEELAQEQELLSQIADQDKIILELRKQLADADHSTENLSQQIRDLNEQQRDQQAKRSSVEQRIAYLNNQLSNKEEVEKTLINKTEELELKLANLATNSEKTITEISERSKQRTQELSSALQQREKLVKEMSQALQQQDKIIAQLRESRMELLRHSKGTNISTKEAVRYHAVQRGDTLSQISMQYYGTANRWKEIYQANRDHIADVKEISVGTTLLIP